ncbi:hypothetical protein GJ744_004462 [Endocarpon pusillum]|uniref:Uncharacterized protein n=1 Tax=Endocarpon pusillum TaxID=364733 RepID=A0A8H7E9G0_9EURO|nr:hypothetical protein GJ744_004462 [Endocarpon pusillum]
MYGLSLGVQRMSETLPSPVYALLSGLNASTVGIITLTAVQLAEKQSKTRSHVSSSSSAHAQAFATMHYARRRRRRSQDEFSEDTANDNAVPLEDTSSSPNVAHRRTMLFHLGSQPRMGVQPTNCRKRLSKKAIQFGSGW